MCSGIHLLIHEVKSSTILYSKAASHEVIFNKSKTIEQIKNTKNEWRNRVHSFRKISNSGSMVTLCNCNWWMHRYKQGTTSVLMKEKCSVYKNQSDFDYDGLYSLFDWKKRIIGKKRWFELILYRKAWLTELTVPTPTQEQNHFLAKNSNNGILISVCFWHRPWCTIHG